MEQNYVTVTLCIADCSQSTRCFKTAGPGAEIYSELQSASLEFFFGGVQGLENKMLCSSISGVKALATKQRRSG